MNIKREIIFTARDGIRLIGKEFVPHNTIQIVCIFLHGASVNSSEYVSFAESLTQKGIQLCLLDLRGHGDSEGERGNVSYVGQYEDDLHDIIQQYYTNLKKNILFVLGGHSAGAAIILRYIEKYNTQLIDGYLLISPAVFRFNLARYHDFVDYCDYFFTNWRLLRPYRKPPKSLKNKLAKFHLINLLLSLLFPIFRNKLNVFQFPIEYDTKNNKKIFFYTYNAVAAFSASRIYTSVFKKISKKTLIIIGKEDELIIPSALYKIIFTTADRHLYCNFQVVNDASHSNICFYGISHILSWLDALTSSNGLNDRIKSWKT